MFDSKRNSIYSKKEVTTTSEVKNLSDMNIFEKEMFKEEHKTYSGNGSVKIDTTGNIFVDDFGSLAMYREPRSIQEIFNTMNKMWEQSPINTLKLLGYIRMISRDTRYMEDIFRGSKGQGLKFESLGRLMWVAIYHPNVFKKNILLYISIGSWQDLFKLMELDLSYIHNGRNRVLDWKWIAAFIGNYLQDPNHCDLIKKYLPTIKSAKNCNTMHSQCSNYIGKFLAKSWFGDGDKDKLYSQYRRLKSSGNAHSWQQAISRQDYSNINFDVIAGRALNKLVNSKFLENHNLEEKYEQWILEQPVAKFTGYVYELLAPVHANMKKYQYHTINKQFEGLVEQGKKGLAPGKDKFIVAIDSSGSMSCSATGTSIPCITVAKAIGLYMSYLLDGPFADTFMEFESKVQLHSWSNYSSRIERYNCCTGKFTNEELIIRTASTPCEKFLNPLSGFCGSTNFIGCADVLVEMLQKGYKESDFPTGLIAISDGELNRTGNRSNFEEFRIRLHNGGFSKEFCDNFKIVLWDLSNGYYGQPKANFETLADCPNCYQMSGLDPQCISFILGQEIKGKTIIPKTAEELFEIAMSQEILEQIEL